MCLREDVIEVHTLFQKYIVGVDEHNGAKSIAVVAPMKYECRSNFILGQGPQTWGEYLKPYECWITVNAYGCRLIDGFAFLRTTVSGPPTPGRDAYCDASHPRITLPRTTIRSFDELHRYFMVMSGRDHYHMQGLAPRFSGGASLNRR